MESKRNKNGTNSYTKINVENNYRRNRRSKYLIVRIVIKIVYFVKLTIAFVLTLGILPLLLLMLLPFYVLRYIIFKTSQMIRPSELGKMMSSRSSIIGVVPIYKDTKRVLVGRLVCDGQLNYHNFIQELQSSWIDAKCPDGSPKYPELSQYVTHWLGLYIFWKNETNFKLTDHVKLYQRSPEENSQQEVSARDENSEELNPLVGSSEANLRETEESVNQLMAKLVSKTFESHKSPWEIYVIPNYDIEKKMDKTALIIRWHHSLMDGLSTFKLLSQFTTLSMDTVPKPRSQNKKTSRWVKIWPTISFIYRAPYEALVTSIESLDKNAWHLSEGKLSQKSHFRWSEAIPVDTLHEIKTNYQVTFSTVIFAALTGTLRNFMEKTKPNEKIPKIIHAALPFPYPGGGHPPRLRNHMSMCTAKLPVGIEDPIERLYWIDDHLNELRNSTIPFVSFHIMPFLGSLPIFLLKRLIKNNNTTCMFSHMPGPTEKFQNANGQTFSEWCFTSDHGPGSVGISIFCLSYGGKLISSTVVDHALVSSPSLAEELSEGVVNEISKLKNLYNCTAPETGIE